jgi:hypothetical protein
MMIVMLGGARTSVSATVTDICCGMIVMLGCARTSAAATVTDICYGM